MITPHFFPSLCFFLFREVFSNLVEKQFPAPNRRYVDKNATKTPKTPKSKSPNGSAKRKRSASKSSTSTRESLDTRESIETGSRSLRTPAKRPRMVIYSDDSDDDESVKKMDVDTDTDDDDEFSGNFFAIFSDFFVIQTILFKLQPKRNPSDPILKVVVIPIRMMMMPVKNRHRVQVNHHSSSWILRPV